MNKEMNKVYVVSGLRYFTDNTFELDEMPISVHIDLEEANAKCESEFRSMQFVLDGLSDGEEYKDIEVEITTNDDGTKHCAAYSTDNGDRVIMSVTAYAI